MSVLGRYWILFCHLCILSASLSSMCCSAELLLTGSILSIKCLWACLFNKSSSTALQTQRCPRNTWQNNIRFLSGTARYGKHRGCLQLVTSLHRYSSNRQGKNMCNNNGVQKSFARMHNGVIFNHFKVVFYLQCYFKHLPHFALSAHQTPPHF